VKAANTERKRIRALEERTQRWKLEQHEEAAADDIPNPNDAPTADRPERPTTGVTFGRNKAQTNSSGNIAVVAESTETPTVKLTKRQRNRVNKKQKKINGLAKLPPASADERVEAVEEAAEARAEEDRPSEGVATNTTCLDDKRRFYAHASATAPSARAAFESNRQPNWVKVRYDETTLSIPTDTANGFYHEADDGTFVCSLIPREHALEGRTSGSFARHVATHAFVLENIYRPNAGRRMASARAVDM
jgi:hypothetical protein